MTEPLCKPPSSVLPVTPRSKTALYLERLSVRYFAFSFSSSVALGINDASVLNADEIREACRAHTFTVRDVGAERCNVMVDGASLLRNKTFDAVEEIEVSISGDELVIFRKRSRNGFEEELVLIRNLKLTGNTS